ncbi:enoyl-CoA hydratase/isomerase family protein [Pseudomaricurvus alkylphenolicus]|jgi:enoyl-CoA hydratase/carnithine racemase|uniref:enoyl-CoA hydratase/isomerase family protein n=1 Tax=Pseudomaricurvus alkylphenolicus TaxID=1306991 RepID=UPI0014246EBD|nr:enoyl-CoA hydratase/isomerase family protein [Pseudomaricurvus alkylphenolicus]NIB40078.1 enoyl-CoA hydratase/isomerase family protein [Pseudomaricurvus alkylphenolicus]
MPDTSVLLTTEGTIATLTLNIPERHNSLAGPQIDLIRQYLDQIEANPELRVLIVTGAGEKTFCSGAALDELGSGSISGELFADMTDHLAALPIPTICAFNGSAYGGGSEIGLACDFRIGINGMRLFVPPARIGLCYPVNGIQRFVTTLGINTAKRLLIASEEFDAQELKNVGYLTHLVERDQLQDTVRHLAERIAGYAPLAVKAMKNICNHSALGDLNLDAANAIAQHCNNSEDLKEGFRSVSEKRKPVFHGR